MENNNNSYVKTKNFQWIIKLMVTILIVIFGVIGAGIKAIDYKTEINEKNIYGIKEVLIEIKTDVKYIKEDIKND